LKEEPTAVIHPVANTGKQFQYLFS